MDQFVGQLMLVGFNFNPVGWALTAGQLLPISQNTALFSLLGTQYGGNGTSTFALPNLQGCTALGFGQGPELSQYDQGQTGGTQTVTLLSTETPPHNHSLLGANGGGLSAATGNAWGNSATGGAGAIYSSSTSPIAQMNANAVGIFGGNQPHDNMMPYLTLNWIICMQGVYPTRG